MWVKYPTGKKWEKYIMEAMKDFLQQIPIRTIPTDLLSSGSYLSPLKIHYLIFYD